jgi:hypothetical protein
LLPVSLFYFRAERPSDLMLIARLNARFGRISRSFSINSVAIRLKKLKNPSEWAFRDATGQFRLAPSLDDPE